MHKKTQNSDPVVIRPFELCKILQFNWSTVSAKGLGKYLLTLFSIRLNKSYSGSIIHITARCVAQVLVYHSVEHLAQTDETRYFSYILTFKQCLLENRIWISDSKSALNERSFTHSDNKYISVLSAVSFHANIVMNLKIESNCAGTPFFLQRRFEIYLRVGIFQFSPLIYHTQKEFTNRAGSVWFMCSRVGVQTTVGTWLSAKIVLHLCFKLGSCSSTAHPACYWHTKTQTHALHMYVFVVVFHWVG